MKERVKPNQISEDQPSPTNKEPGKNEVIEKSEKPEKQKNKVESPVYVGEELDELFKKPYGQYWY